MKIEIVRDRLDHMVLSKRARDAVDSCCGILGLKEVK